MKKVCILICKKWKVNMMTYWKMNNENVWMKKAIILLLWNMSKNKLVANDEEACLRRQPMYWREEVKYIDVKIGDE